MRVKRLEIQGFKSFKDKTVVHFDHGITGVVGPNGCGKSNIVDAFFWVMGEQSYKHMRGSSSDDLIFNGSSKYSPLGMAEATLVMEAELADTTSAPAGASSVETPLPRKMREVSVTRRLYRSGEGEYFINGVQARLKDIHELFMDTGVGAKGYSVIEQGQIGKIVNSKPEDRRLLVEEAAGIAKYKARKKESLRKIEATQTNLNRLNDVIAEIERNLASLERQAQKARLYKKYKDELLDKELTWGRRKNKVLKERIEAVSAQKTMLEQELVGLRAELQTTENSIESLRVTQLTDSKEAEERQSGIQALSDELTQEKSALELSKRRQSDLEQRLEQLAAEKQELTSSVVRDKGAVEQRATEATQAAGSLDALLAQVAAAESLVREARAQVEQSRRATDAAKRELLQGISESSELSSKASALLAKAESLSSQAQRAREQLGQTISRETESQSTLAQASQSRDTARTRFETLKTEKIELQQKAQAAEQEVRATEKSRNESQREWTQLKSRLQSLEELAQANEGMSDAPKAALDWAATLGRADALAALASLYEAPQEYEEALTSWLDSDGEALTGSDASLAIEAIGQVREAKQGRIQVYLRGAETTGSGSELKQALESAGLSVAGLLTDLVKASSPVARARIQGAWVVQGFQGVSDAQLQELLAKAQATGWSAISLDGTVLDSRGAIRGGSSDQSGATGVLRRKRQIGELTEQLAQATTQLEACEAKFAAAREAQALSVARLQALQSDLQAAEVELAGLERDVLQAQRQVQELARNVAQLTQECQDRESEAAQCESGRAQAQERLNAILSTRTGMETRIAELEAEQLMVERALAERDSAAQMLKIDEASARERAQSLGREVESIRGVIRDRERRISEIERVVQSATQERESFSGGESGLEVKIAELTQRLGQERERMSVVKDRLEQASTQLNGGLERIKALHHAGDDKQAQVTQLSIDTEKLTGELAHLLQNLEEKYGPGCLERPTEQAPGAIQSEMENPVVTTEMTAEEEQLLGEEVERLRERIRRLGEVNVMAVEEYDETKKRFDYLTQERSDLHQSMANLHEAIEHINKTSEERFKKAFEAISDRFERLFPVVFGGGMAQLSLVYPEGSTDILEAGIDILAQPPGKKVSNIGLLSGGEKALTAVSLIFAIFMVKPSPFCILDEVDAPLDDANIGKFNALLREMAAKSQFIVITHNKKTMELNDSLYGVTMEEPGVSKMVSIEMR